MSITNFSGSTSVAKSCGEFGIIHDRIGEDIFRDGCCNFSPTWYLAEVMRFLYHPRQKQIGHIFGCGFATLPLAKDVG